MGEYQKHLSEHPQLAARSADSAARIERILEKLGGIGAFKDPGLTIFIAGSVARGESGKRSDLDLFVVTTKAFDVAKQEGFLAEIRKATVELGYEAPTERFLKVLELAALLKNTGSPEDDTHNSFTARMLLLLESKSAINDDTYAFVRDQVLSQYFRDGRGKAVFRPLFLMNDVLRYWRTLCLNYEDLRHDRERPWWKKNASLKFSRMMTVFATVAPLIIVEMGDKSDFQPLCDQTPLQRLSWVLDALNDKDLRGEYAQALDDYESFLQWKEADIDAEAARQGYARLRAKADSLSSFLYRILHRDSIPIERRKYLVI
ncbi:MAG: nucleotidyltransferase domain-containing protein [Steroidobacteraceae bacterium]